MSKKCKECGEAFKPFKSTQKVCGYKCAASYAKKAEAKKKVNQQKEEDKVWRDKKRKLNDTVKNWTKKAQAEFNKYIRLRDKDKPCVSCGKREDEIKHSSRGGLWDCGHYRSVGACPELRFEPKNAHKQCKHCNQFLSGNHIEYRFGISQRLTKSELEWIEGAHEPKRYRVEDLKEIQKAFKAKTKALKALL